MIYGIQYRPQAVIDIDRILDYIENELFDPVTAERFFSGILAKIKTLEFNAGIFAISRYRDVLKYDHRFSYP